MRGVDAQSIVLETGRWFFEAEACEQANTEQATFPGCVTALLRRIGEVMDIQKKFAENAVPVRKDQSGSSTILRSAANG